ncbi:MAG: Flp pilus assembly complex ATPase component [Myxococcales bacterium]|nr:Flp pilus assembly complex ATPase component [Myxococcales bacterium]
MELLITGTDGIAQRHSFETAEAVVLGRDPDCHLVLNNLDVSRRHVTLRDGATGICVVDSSSNGTFVGNRRILNQEVLIEGVEELKVGPYCIRFIPRVPPAPAQATSSADADARAWHIALRRRIHRQLLDTLNLGKMQRDKMDDETMRPQVLEALQQLVSKVSEELPRGFDSAVFVQELANEALGLGPLEGLLADSSVSEIMVVDPQVIYVERNGKIELADCSFTDDNAARAAIERIVTPLGRRIDEATPFVDARLKDGSRVNAVIRPLALRGACITIRKFNANGLSIKDLMRFDSMNLSMGRFLERSVKARRNIVISGGTGSGKTTLLNVLSQSICESERVVTIEDAAELQLAQEHVVSLESRPPNMEGRGEITIRDLVRNALRMRPDRILVGECRGGEAIDMLQAMNTGHDGSMTTTHANNPREAIRRLETLVLMSGIDLPTRAIREQIAGSIDLIVQQSRLSDGSRKVTSVAEVVGIGEDGKVELREIFAFNRSGTGPDGKALGRFQATGFLPSYLEDLIRLGLIDGDDYL